VKIRIPVMVAGLALGGALLMSSVSVAAAVTTPAGPSGKGVCSTQATTLKAGGSVDSLRAFGDCEIARRMTTLTSLAGKISASKALTPADATALTGEVSATKAGLTSLKATIDSETDIAALKADVAGIATQFRVYLLVVPQVNLVSAADGIVGAQTRFADVNTKLAARIATDKAAGKDTTAAQTALDAMNAAATKAVGLAQPVPAELLPLTPAQYDGGTAGPIITGARTALGQARDQMKAAIADAKACRDALKALK
jgi:hypothetical protein